MSNGSSDMRLGMVLRSPTVLGKLVSPSVVARGTAQIHLTPKTVRRFFILASFHINLPRCGRPGLERKRYDSRRRSGSSLREQLGSGWSSCISHGTTRKSSMRRMWIDWKQYSSSMAVADWKCNIMCWLSSMRGGLTLQSRLPGIRRGR